MPTKHHNIWLIQRMERMENSFMTEQKYQPDKSVQVFLSIKMMQTVK
jgi:hypothetical protein